MFTIRKRITSTVIGSAVLVFASVPMAPLAFAAMTPPDANGNSCFIVGSDQPGVHKPVGSDASLFTYNCTTNLWQSAHYTFDPITDQESPITPPVYTYNTATGNYDYQQWDYSAPLSNYVLDDYSTPTPPAGADVVGGPPPPSSTIDNTGADSNNSISNSGGAGGNQTISNTGADSGNSIANNGTSNTGVTNNTGVTVATTLQSQATSGSAMVLANTTGGDAASGNALDEATIINELQSASNSLGTGNTVTFVANIDGDVNGDLLVDPASLGSIQPASDPTTSNTTVNNTTDAAINNNVNLAAQSGDATVADNTTAGNATTGSAEAIANVVNLIDSAISSGKSFVGTININGNLNGNILVPQSFVDQLVANNVPTVTIANTGQDSNNDVNDGTSGQNTTVNNNTNQGINNNVSSGAQSGDANVDGNTTAGSATTGSAGTSITAFNLTGSNILGSNDLLVFVNVVGSWVGMIINAPPGATAAELGSGVTSNNTSGNTTVNNTTNQQINNNINVAAQSGDANVTDNTTAGNAKSGNAGTAVNLLNVANSSLSFTGWFGILFINVFGSWNGNFGVYSAAAPVPGSPAAAAESAAIAASVPVFRFVPTGGSSGGGLGSFASITNSASGSGGSTGGTVLAAKTIKDPGGTPTPQLQNPKNSKLTYAVIGSLVLLYIIADALISHRRAGRKTPST